MIHQSILHKIENHLSVKINAYVPAGGGSVNHTLCLDTTGGRFFLKMNSASRYPQMFEKEVKALNFLRSKNVVQIPDVIYQDKTEEHSFLLLNWIDYGRRPAFFWQKLGSSVAALHKESVSQFGWDEDNYIGSLPQINTWKNSWSEFFISYRLEPMLQMAINKKGYPSVICKKFESLYKQIDNIFPVEAPSLLHGDLWNGNYMASSVSEPVLIDPAVYYGHREMDIAMTTMFGRCNEDFYQSYNEHFPLQKGWEERIDICNLYPLLVHANLIGQGYWQSVESILKRF